jgi:hypothetical protein
MRAYRFVFDNPQWAMNILWVSLCLLSTSAIPVIGNLLMLGYLYEAAEFMHRRKQDTEYPDFTFDRFSKYLMRGLWVFLVQMIASLPVLLLLVPFYIVLFVVLAANKGEPNAAFFAVLAGFMVLMLVLGIALSLVMVPLILRAGLSQDFKTAFSMEFLKDFVRRMWRQVLLAQLFLMVTSIPLTFAGMLVCCIGLYPVAALISFAQVHLHYQLYELYLERGGMEIPLKEEDLPAARTEAPRPVEQPPTSEQ